jgi:hypothetical protein
MDIVRKISFLSTVKKTTAGRHPGGHIPGAGGGAALVQFSFWPAGEPFDLSSFRMENF